MRIFENRSLASLFPHSLIRRPITCLSCSYNHLIIILYPSYMLPVSNVTCPPGRNNLLQVGACKIRVGLGVKEQLRETKRPFIFAALSRWNEGIIP